MRTGQSFQVACGLALLAEWPLSAANQSRAAELLFTNILNVIVPHISTDKSVRFAIVYARRLSTALGAGGCDT